MSVKVSDYLASARRTLAIERQALADLEARLDGEFERAIARMAGCTGKLVVSGMGKSGLIGRKMAATFASTGSPAFFLHPGEAGHGDLGMVGRDDVVMLLSNSGETEEILRLLPALKRMQAATIALVGNPRSSLAAHCDIVLDVSVREEACPLGLAPTASTTVLLALGDALAVALLEHRGFTADDFAAVHPGGALGKRLLTHVRDVMHRGSDLPLVGSGASLREALWMITSKRLGACGVAAPDERLIGIITDGDIRRAIEGVEERVEDGQGGSGDSLLTIPVVKIMTPSPKTISSQALAVDALNMMQQYTITCLFVTAEDGRPEGILHLHDLLKAGVV
jgi:arabinose-5-phosphate isomerase